MSRNSKVVWSEGLFLEPQHFQQHDRYLERQIEGRTRSLLGYGWGFVTIEIDQAALALGKVQLTAAQGIFPDGTPFDFPAEDAPPPAIDIPTDVKNEIIVLAVPVRRPGTDETDFGSQDADPSLARFSVGLLEVTDSNSSASGTATVRIGSLRMRLMRKSESTDAYTTLGVVEIIERRSNQVLLSKSYVPPMLHASEDATLSSHVRELHGLLRHRGEALAGRLSQLGSGGVSEIANFLLLQTVNRYTSLYAHLATLALLHPERLYSVCVQLAGELATFSDTETRTAEFPEYKHDALEATFTPVMKHLRRLLNMVFAQNATPIELHVRPHGLRVAVIHDPDLLKNASFVLAVAARLPADALQSSFPKQAKVGPSERIGRLVNYALPGIPLRPLPVAPRQIPFHTGYHYFELERGDALWQQFEGSGGLAIHIAGEFPGLQLEFWAIRS